MATDSVSRTSIVVHECTGAVLDVCSMDSFEIGGNIGCGSFGRVLKAHHPIFNDVAIKILKCEERDTAINEAKRIRKLCAYSSIVNVHCVADAGEGKPVGIVMEWMKLGNLKDFQQKKGRKIPWALCMRMLKEISEGMFYLHHHHEPPIVHGDLKAENIFVQETLSVKIGDLGLSRSMQSMMNREKAGTPTAGTPTHMPPEYFDVNERPNPKWDVYSFGILQYEVASGKIPFEALQGDLTRLYFFVVVQNERPNISKINDCPPVINKLMTECWDCKPANRPDFKDVKLRIQNAYRTDFEESINRATVDVHQQLDNTTETDAKNVEFGELNENGGPLPLDTTRLPIQVCGQDTQHATTPIHDTQTERPTMPGRPTQPASTAHYAAESTTHVVPKSTGKIAPVVITHGFRELNNKDIRCVKKHLRKDNFRDLGREFDLTEAEMDAIEEDNRFYGEQVYALIHKWQQKEGLRTRDDLFKCLKDLDLTIIDELNKLYY